MKSRYTSNGLCTVEGCERPNYAKGFCKKHHQWNWKRGLLPKDIPPEIRFFEQVIYEPMSGCWLWGGTCHTHGYGLFHGSPTCGGYAHRFSYEFHKGTIPAGKEVRHRCNNASCVNPDHLEIGTHAENMHDMATSGIQKGSGNHSAKVTESQVLEIRARRAKGELYRQIAADYGLTPGSARAIAIGKNWGHVGGELAFLIR